MMSMHSKWWSIAFWRMRVVVVREGAELVVLVLEGVRVDRAERDAEVLGVAAQVVVVVDLVPRDVQGDARRERRVGVDLRGIRDLLERVARRAGVVNTRKRVPELPNAHEGSSMAWPSRVGLDFGGQRRHDAVLSSSWWARRVAAASWSWRLKISVSGVAAWSGRPSRPTKKRAHLGLPAGGDGGCREIGLRGVVVVGLVVADEPSAFAEEERVVAPAGGRDLARASRARPGVCRARYSSRQLGSTCSSKQTRVVAVVLVIESTPLRRGGVTVGRGMNRFNDKTTGARSASG